MIKEARKQINLCRDCRFFVCFKGLNKGKCKKYNCRNYNYYIEDSKYLTDYFFEECKHFTLNDKLSKLGIKRKI